MAYEMVGKLHKIFPTEQKTDSFQAREFVVLTENERYPQFIKFQLTQDRCDIMDKYQEGQAVKVHFDLRGREWNDKYFTNLNAWKVEIPEDMQQDTSPEDFPDLNDDSGFPTTEQSNSAGPEDFDDLPF